MHSYTGFARFLPPNFNLITLEYPGRGSRIREALVNDMDALIEDVFLQLKESDTESPYVIYGHSMGAVVGYLMMKKVLENQLSLPLALFFTGAAALSTLQKEPVRHQMSKEEFIEDIMRLGGSPDEILLNRAFMEFYEPILRADFEAIEKYAYQKTLPCNTPMYVITGSEENITPQQAILWQEETTADFEFTQLPGKHFFIFDHAQTLIAYIQNKVDRLYHHA